MKKSTDSWMVLPTPQSLKVNDHGLEIKQVTDENLLHDFLEVYTPIWDNPRYLEAFKRKLFIPEYSSKSKVYVGYTNNKPVVISGWVSHNNISFIHSIATKDEFRKKGYGEAMIRHAVAETACGEVVFPVGSSFVNARRLAAKIGFKELMEVRIYCR